MSKTRKEIYRDFPLKVGQIVKGKLNIGERWENIHYFKVLSIHKHCFQAMDINSGAVYGFPKVDWYTGAIK